jgi:propane monooxygenase coupling protein
MSDGNGFKVDHTSSNQCGVTLMNNQNGYTIARVMAGKPGVTVRELPSMIRVDGIGKIEFDFDEIGEAMGWEFSAHDFEEVMSTHYGRMVVLDDKLLFFANPEDAAEYIGFDLQPVAG